MLTISNISKSFGARTLFSDVSLQIVRTETIGLVGPNGAGKSTLFSLILGEQAPDEGAIVWQKGAEIGYLPQESAPAGDETVLELACAISDEMRDLMRIVKGADPEAEESEAYHDAHMRFIELDGYQLEPKAKRILAGLAFRESDFNRPARELSGGWIMRAHLARLLVMEPDLLMLDEPTNHLDLDSLSWFENYLSTYPGAILMISHDRDFLNQLCDSIIDIRHGKVSRYRGNYDKYLRERADRDSQLLNAYRNQQREIAQLQRFADRFRAKASKAAQAQSKLKQIERMEKIEAPMGSEKTIHFTFPQPKRAGLKVMNLEDVEQAYGKFTVYRDLNFNVERGDRIVLVGPNGAGKSTLLKIMAGVVPICAGERKPGLNVKIGYYSQHRVEMLDPERTVLEEVGHIVSEQEARTILGCFLFSGDDVFKRVGVLSGGEKSRLALVKLLLDPPNLLLMDEPTTHLDMPSIDALIEALKQYTGTLVFISHDVYFIRALADKTLHINAGVPTLYPGGYDYYLEKTQAESAKAGTVAGENFAMEDARPEDAPAKDAESKSDAEPAKRRKTKEEKRREAEERQARSAERKARVQRVRDLEKEITSLETRIRELTEALEDPAVYEADGNAMELSREMEGVTESLERATAEWERHAAEEEEAPV